MRLSISNIAWDVDEDSAISGVLQEHGIDAIDVAPGKYFPEPSVATDADIRGVREWWAGEGMEIIGMQALLFGTEGLNLFGGAASRSAMLEHLRYICRIGAGLGARRLVFGSPRNRDRAGLEEALAHAMAVQFFRHLGDIAESHGVVVCLEPNPPRYGANFMTSATETASVVRDVDHPAIRMQFDTGAITISGEDPAELLAAHHRLVAHVHASEPDLVTLGTGTCDHRAMGRLLQHWMPQTTVTVEMVADGDNPHVEVVSRAVRVAIDAYRDPAR